MPSFALPEDAATTADAFAGMRSTIIGIDLADIIAAAGSRTGGVGRALVLDGIADKTKAIPVKRWIDAVRSCGFESKSLFITKLLQGEVKQAFTLDYIDSFCTALQNVCGVAGDDEVRLASACLDAGATALVAVAFQERQSRARANIR